MVNPLVEIGVGGTFAILVIREVFAFINHRRRNGHNDRREAMVHRVKSPLNTGSRQFQV